MKRKRYSLSPQGLQSLRHNIQLNRPYARSTGPKTYEGKQLSSLNAFKHGARCRRLYRLPAANPQPSTLEPLNP